MFQSFEATASPDQGPPRLAELRKTMAEAGVDGFIVPRADSHQGEYVAPCDERLSWLTGFTGSAGFAVALKDIAGVFIDGRYRAQVRDHVDLDHYTPVHWPEVALKTWVIDHMGSGQTLAFDPWLHSVDEIDALRRALEPQGIGLVASNNLVDEIWSDQPSRPAEPMQVFPADIAGASLAEKCAMVVADLKDSDHQALILTLPDSICWLLNIRGADIPRIPIVHSFAIVHDDGRVDLFADAPADDAMLHHLGDAVSRHGYGDLLSVCATLTGKVRIDPKTVPVKVSQHLTELADVEVVQGADPCVLAKARKSDAEIAATREAHLRDGAAMVEFLTWFDDRAPQGGLSEIDAAKSLEGFRRATNALHDISFDTISGSGPNGAIVHYRVTEGTNREIQPGDLYLVDSGGQYIDGTTDITRTIAVGMPGEEERDCFTRVLQGMIAISCARFPRGLSGRDLDALARAPLWRAGRDYDHGTGHGVGVFLSVHEGPQRISRVSQVPLEPGMILSNEPGYYREGAFGIRIENLIVVREAEQMGDGRDQLDFETLTFTPIDLRLIDSTMLSGFERDWLNAYHAEVREKLAPRVSDAAQDWLKAATRPI